MINIPIKSHHCTTTHSACDCVLERLKKLERVANMSKKVKAFIAHSCDCNLSYDNDHDCNCGVNEFYTALAELERE